MVASLSSGSSVRDGDDQDGLAEGTAPGGSEDGGLEDLGVEGGSEGLREKEGRLRVERSEDMIKEDAQ